MPNLDRPNRSAHAARQRADNLAKIEAAAAGDTPPVPFDCPLCGQRITDGRPCGCGVRPVLPSVPGRGARVRAVPAPNPAAATGERTDDPTPPQSRPAAEPKIQHDDRGCIRAAVDFVRYGMADRRCPECRKWKNGSGPANGHPA